MQVNFSSAEDFVAEVAAMRTPEISEISGDVVRVQIEEDSEHGCLTKYYVRAGFIDLLGGLHQFVKDCGVEPPAPREPHGRPVAEACEEWLRDELKKLGVQVRRGSFVGGA